MSTIIDAINEKMTERATIKDIMSYLKVSYVTAQKIRKDILQDKKRKILIFNDIVKYLS